jgi:multidrug efflux system outer membrane protein
MEVEFNENIHYEQGRTMNRKESSRADVMPSFIQRHASRHLLAFCSGVALLCVCLAFSACVTSESSPAGSAELDVPANWSAAANARVTTDPVAGWLQDLSAPGLEPLVREAIEHNRDLKAAAARLSAAKARAVVAGADRWPQLGGDLRGSHSKRERNRNQSNLSNGEAAATDLSSLSFEDYDLGLNLSWEIDLWGRLRNVQRAAIAEYQASRADFYAARLSLAANSAKGWFNAVEAARLNALANETLASFKSNLEVVVQAFERGINDDAGTDNALDIRLARANVATAEANVHATRRNLDAAKRSLEVLLGRYPAEQIAVANSFPNLPRGVPAGLPSELLLRRPDILASEWRLSASGERVSAARKAFLPSIRLTASEGSQTARFRDLLDADTIAKNIAANLAQPLFEGGRLLANSRIAGAEREENIETYAQIALTAFEEVETTLAAERYLAEQEAALEVAAAESVQAESLAETQYSRGLVDIITVLESQRRSFNSRSALISISNQRLQNRIDLYLSLGGDFDSLQDAADLPASQSADNAPGRKEKRSRPR